MFKRILFTGALFAAGAASAQEVAISGKDFLSGAGDAKIAELARQAAASGKTLRDHCSAVLAGQGGGEGTFRGGQRQRAHERCLLRKRDGPRRGRQTSQGRCGRSRTETGASGQARGEAGTEARAATGAARAQAGRGSPRSSAETRAGRDAATTAAGRSQTRTTRRGACAGAPAPVAAPVAAPPPAAAAAPAKPAADPSAAIKKRFEQNLNGGQAAEGTLAVAQLQKDDLVYENGSVRAVVRRFGPRTQLFWLEGELNMERAELVPTGTDRYRVSEPIRNVANPSLRGGGKATAMKFVGNVPAPKSPTRAALEKQYNDGRDISGTVQAVDLRAGDLVYTAEGAAVVIRRTSVGLERYWLTGEIDLHQTGLQQTGNAIRVLTDNVK